MQNPALDYAKSVLSGQVIACKFVKQSCERFINDLERKDIVFDLAAANNAIKLVQLQKHTKGEWKGQLLKIEPWQKFIVANLFGFKRLDGCNRFQRCYAEMPKKQGKSPLAAAIGNIKLMDEDDGSPEVYSAATKLGQAAIVWDYAAGMMRGLKSDFDIEASISDSFNNKRIVYEGGVFMPIAYDERDKNDGFSVSCAIIDEYHAHPSDRIYNVLADGMAARKSPLLLAITTAGHDRQSACYKHREYCVKVLEGTFVDDSLFVMIFTIDEGDKWDDEGTWMKANPNYGISVKPDYIKSKIAEARESGGKRDSFLIKHLNVWTDSYKTWIASSTYQNCESDFEIPEFSKVYGGLDLASTGDFTALSFDWVDNGIHHVKSYYYLPEERVRSWKGQVGKQVREWVEKGIIVQTEGDTTDYDYVEQEIKRYCEKYEVVSIGYDTANAKQFASKLFTDGINMRPFSQAIMNISKPTKTVDELIRGKKYKHDGNKCTEWQFGNAVLYQDANDNHKIIKGKDADKKVDGVISIIMAVGEAIDESNKENWWFEPSVV